MVSLGALSKFGYNHANLNMKERREILDSVGVRYDAGANSLELLVAVERYFANLRVEQGEAPTGYLEQSFNARGCSVAELRQLLTQHGIDYGTIKVTRDDLVAIFEDNIEEIRDDAGYYNRRSHVAHSGHTMGSLTENLNGMSMDSSSAAPSQRSRQPYHPRERRHTRVIEIGADRGNTSPGQPTETGTLAAGRSIDQASRSKGASSRTTRSGSKNKYTPLELRTMESLVQNALMKAIEAVQGNDAHAALDLVHELAADIETVMARS